MSEREGSVSAMRDPVETVRGLGASVSVAAMLHALESIGERDLVSDAKARIAWAMIRDLEDQQQRLLGKMEGIRAVAGMLATAAPEAPGSNP